MSDFNTCVNFVLDNEGGFVVDNGGATNFGITAKYLTAMRYFQYDRNKNGIIDEEDMRNFTKEDAISVYKIMFMNNRYNMINSDDIAMRVFDMGVNSGEPTANRMLQSSYNKLLGIITPLADLLKIKRLAVDGVIGKFTIAAINSVNQSNVCTLLGLFRDARINYYQKLAESNPEKYGSSLNGWQNRAYK